MDTCDVCPKSDVNGAFFLSHLSVFMMLCDQLGAAIEEDFMSLSVIMDIVHRSKPF